ncbi:hypothetical protein FRB95_006169 [Tulasnella sp. JGI-2019a]|nr:hypothetical protein FRB95_006169 [Tulasnella sp. JGI-2019a]
MEEYIDSALSTLIQGASRVAGLGLTGERDGSRELETQHQELRAMESALELLKKRMECHISTKRRRRNSQLPISRLPHELLIEIFHLSLTTDDNYFDDLLDLALVSKDWNIVVFETPFLWTFIHSAHPRSPYSTTLAKSKGLPLRIKLEDVDPGPSYLVDPEISRFLASIYKEVHRWRAVELDFQSCDSFQTIKHIQSLAAPYLEELVIDLTYCNYAADMELEALLEGGTPRLRYLTLYDVPLLWTPRLLFRLRYLTIVGYTVLGPSEGEAANILRECPDLVELYLHCHNSTIDLEPIPMTPIDLPSLAALNLGVPPGMLGALLTLIRIPACRTLRIWEREQERTPKIITEATRHLAPVIQSITHSVPVLSIELEGARVAVNAGIRSTTRLQLHFRQDSLKDIFTWILGDSYSDPSLPEISLSAKYHEGDIMTALEELPSVSKLNVEGAGNKVVTFLTHPLMKDGTLHWHLPDLQRLSLSKCDPIDLYLVIRMVESRSGHNGKGRSHNGGKEEKQVLPCKLKHLCLPNIAANSGDLQSLTMLKKLMELSFRD